MPLRLAGPALFRQTNGGREIRCTSPQSNAHRTDSREVLYRWHPWHGRIVWIHQARQVNGRVVLRCALEPGRDLHALEIPQWMFEAASCALVRFDEQPAVNAESLRELKRLVALGAGSSARAVVEDQHHSFSREGDADAILTEREGRDSICSVSSSSEESVLGAIAPADASADRAIARASSVRAGGKGTRRGALRGEQR
jgi:hypothetical protein